MNEFIQIRTDGFIALLCVMCLFISGIFFLFLRYRRRCLNFLDERQKMAVVFDEQVEKVKMAAKAKSDFLSQMSHEIRTPINAIMGMAQIAQNTTNPDMISDCIKKIADNSKHLLMVVNDILDFSKIESGSFVFTKNRFSLTREIDLIASMYKAKATEKNISLQIKMENILHDGITTDKLRLNQVLSNLLSNAVKFTDSGGAVELTIEEMFHMDGESVYRFVVRDNGTGFEPEQVKKLFTPFMQANDGVSRVYGGAGLGLAISQNIVHMMGGDIELETEFGKGSVFQFTIRVPAKEKDIMDASEDNRYAVSPEKLRGKRIMVVDDIEINREIVAALLDGSGALIEMAANGQEALDAFCGAEPYWYDLILMDIQMPIMDGCTAAEKIRNSGREDARDIKIIALTAHVTQEYVKKAYQSGMNDHLAKPVELTDLYAEMEEWL